MLQIDPSQGLNLKFKMNVTGAALEQLNAWANIEPANNAEVSYQIPAAIENGVLVLKSTLENISIGEKGNLKIKVQNGSNLYDVWNSEYTALEKVQIVLEQIREEKKIEDVKKEEKKVTPIVEKAKVTKAQPKKEEKKEVEKVEETKVEKVFKFRDFKTK